MLIELIKSMLEGDLLVNLISFSIVFVTLSFTLVQSMVDVESFERKQDEKLRKEGASSDIKKAVLMFFITALSFLIAGFNADLPWLWKILSFVFFVLGLVNSFVIIGKKLGKIDDPELPELTDEILNDKIAKRKRTWIIQTLLLLLWLFSWRVLIT